MRNWFVKMLTGFKTAFLDAENMEIVCNKLVCMLTCSVSYLGVKRG